MRAGLVLLAGLLGVAACRQVPAGESAPEQTTLHLLTPLPLLWSETFGLDQPGSPVVAELEKRFVVTPIDLPNQLPEGGLLLAVQPRALPAEELVALDAWVRRGGRLMLLADPMLEWPSAMPLGDPRRAPLAFPDTGLLRHWGLRLDAPDQRGPAQREVGGNVVLTASPGTLVTSGSNCSVNARVVAACTIGRGKAIIVADADWLNVGTADSLDGPTDDNLAALVEQIDSLAR